MHRASGMRQHGAGSPPATATGATGAKGFTSASIATRPPAAAAAAPKLPWIGLHHVGLLCANLEASIAFYRDVLGMEVNVARPDDRLAYRYYWQGAWVALLDGAGWADCCTGWAWRRAP